MRRVLISCAVLLLFATTSWALIAVGLSFNQKIFVQEYWRNEQPFYAIANGTDKEIAVTITTRGGGGAKVGGPWKVKKESTKNFQFKPAEKNGTLARVETANLNLGLIELPGNLTPPVKEGCASCVGINGSGGRDESLWMVEKDRKHPAGGFIEVAFHLKARPGKFSLHKTFNGKLPAGLSFAAIKDAKSETLEITDDEKGVHIELTNPKKRADWHEVTARFQAPEVKTPTLTLVDGWFSSGGGGHVLARGVLVVPKE